MGEAQPKRAPPPGLGLIEASAYIHREGGNFFQPSVNSEAPKSYRGQPDGDLRGPIRRPASVVRETLGSSEESSMETRTAKEVVDASGCTKATTSWWRAESE
ncbi:hypothetical protein MAPG_06397 [Magnaporthiopsis poae ATCC 64411]|uniref:Uncharacterized protein n=1 Tax=Magnaporthiopsis poae (strain ATCC 64411 / 73-15) TaxID=644358 RepID=A0A0C4E1X3_MAGP6|nr:hypothetical protein MAPG_06397 [Magnaporthiopsis poae ATCC 64411]